MVNDNWVIEIVEAAMREVRSWPEWMRAPGMRAPVPVRVVGDD